MTRSQFANLMEVAAPLLDGSNADAILEWAIATFGARLAFATSLGLEDQILTEMIAAHRPETKIFTLDTGRLFAETYDLIRRTESRYGLRIQVYFPDAVSVERLAAAYGINIHRESVELRKECCRARKIEPLRRALHGMDAWICGLRREQSVTRKENAAVEWDEHNGLIKVNPLIHWTDNQVRAYIRDHRIPYHPLHDQGYASIGCACCTRAIEPGEDARAGRWWWEHPEHKECGLHRAYRRTEKELAMT
ncbi:MAG: phosphoadenylyl-sulfate reductase [Candidatus Sumerlaeota bacterium]|nr:phosphoadenylyl-sulfate reductase [Candidatus Sumerlaeota bacterium]